jgi:hypothetical protein
MRSKIDVLRVDRERERERGAGGREVRFESNIELFCLEILIYK